MSYSRSYDKRTGTTYVYEVTENTWSSERKRCEQKRKLIGKIDPVTGDIVPTGPRGRHKKEGAPNPAEQESAIKEMARNLAQERRRAEDLQSRYQKQNENLLKLLEKEERSIDNLEKSINDFVVFHKELIAVLSQSSQD